MHPLVQGEHWVFLFRMLGPERLDDAGAALPLVLRRLASARFRAKRFPLERTLGGANGSPLSVRSGHGRMSKRYQLYAFLESDPLRGAILRVI